ncbi:DUF4913 domain-containing protein [Nocardia sp. IFM 10818]
MTTTDNTNAAAAAPQPGPAAPAAVLAPQALGKTLDEAVRRAVGGQVADVAKQIAKTVLENLLTDAVIAGMEQTAIEAAAAALAPAPEEEEPEEPKKQLRFPDVETFVEEYIAVCYAREVSRENKEGEIRWCPLWHEHPEAVARFEAMWRAWEHLRLGDNVELSNWWRDHADHHMPYLFDPNGPFRHCSVTKGHTEKLVDLPLKAAAEGAFGQEFEQLASGVVIPVSSAAKRGEIRLEFPGK